MDLPNAPLGVPEDFGEQLDVHCSTDRAGVARRNQTRVASFMIAKEVSMRTYPNLQISDAFHPLSHHQNDQAQARAAGADPELPHAAFREVHQEAVGPRRMATASLLDHSIILYGSNMWNSDLHNNDPLPIGGPGRGYGRIKGGQHLKYPQDTPHANLLLTLLERAGLPVEKLGNSTGLLAEV